MDINNTTCSHKFIQAVKKNDINQLNEDKGEKWENKSSIFIQNVIYIICIYQMLADNLMESYKFARRCIMKKINIPWL